jgi:antitoxin (DNA-binding transcriptional repressor) of toxin-antitoxin stability system
MSTSASVEEVSRNLSAFIDRVEHGGERFVLTRGGEPVAELCPIPAEPRVGDLAAIFARLPLMDAVDVEAFGRDVDAARAELDRVPLDDPWER